MRENICYAFDQIKKIGAGRPQWPDLILIVAQLIAGALPIIWLPYVGNPTATRLRSDCCPPRMGLSRRVTTMPRFYFQQHMNGQRVAEDRQGRLFGNAAEACSYALCRAPRLLDKTVRSTPKDTHLSTVVSDGKRTLFIVRGKITSEKA
jgi:hypothetical protein